MLNNSQNSYIYGKNTVFEILSTTPNRINKIYIQKGFSYDNRLKKIIELANENKIIVNNINLQKFAEFFDENTNFQGIIASVSPVEMIDLEEFLEIKKKDFKRIIVLDSVSDPHNFGAIIRTAAAASFDGILIPTHRSCPVSATVEKISSGAVNHIPIIKTSSLQASLDVLKKNDFWVIATQMEAKDNYFEIDYTDMNFALVMGSEGKGISKTILNKADFKVKIKTNFESLNVSNAAAIIIYEALRQIEVKNKALNKS